MKNVGIISYGVSLPKRRLPIDATLDIWKNTSRDLIIKQGVTERGVLGVDEDSNTYAVQALNEAIEKNEDAAQVGALLYGTCTNPYDSRPSSTIIAEAVDYSYDTFSTDIQFSGKSGTTAMIMALGLVQSGLAGKAAAVAADTINRHTSPGDLSEPYAGCGGAAFVLGSENIIATVDGIASWSKDLSDNFRVEGERYIRSGMLLGPAKNEVGLYEHTVNAGKLLMEKLGTRPEDYDYAVFQQTTPRVAYGCAKKLGFQEGQVKPSIYAGTVGDAGCASTLIGLAKVLDKAKAGEKIFVVSYGFGAGADAIALTVTEDIKRLQGITDTVEEHLRNRDVLDYGTAMKCEFKYIRPSHPINAYL